MVEYRSISCKCLFVATFFVFFSLFHTSNVLAFQNSPVVKAEIIHNFKDQANAGDSFFIGIKLLMDEGWHTYWTNPGDSGLATKIEWNLPEGLEVDPIQWPYPKLFKVGDIVNFGYEDEVVLLNKVHLTKTLEDDSFSIGAKVYWLACKEVCIPGVEELQLKIPSNANPELIQKALKKTPLTDLKWEVNANYISGETKAFLALSSLNSHDVNKDMDIEFFPFQNTFIDYAKPFKYSKNKEGYFVEFKLRSADAFDESAGPLKGVVVFHHTKNKEKTFSWFISAPWEKVTGSQKGRAGGLTWVIAGVIFFGIIFWKIRSR